MALFVLKPLRAHMRAASSVVASSPVVVNAPSMKEAP
jgi:hypothetical protein